MELQFHPGPDDSETSRDGSVGIVTKLRAE